ncbi:ATP-binding cassette domain-containing protein [Streptomyces sp. NPDC016459]|uniref:ABC transporter ATP-binding protein n=1 Tax=Streptomyces sp. NPDC016459 TaxID=3157190 RepID=UPI0033D997E9
MRLDGVGRRHGLRGPWVLRDVGLDLPAATLVRVVGTNGTGKSTLLRLVAGVDAPSEGRVTGRPARTAYVPERFPVALPFTAVDYLVHLGRIQGLGRAAARAGAGEWLERLGAAEHARTDMARLSKGGSQKVAVAQAFLADPDLLVLDEAWTGLDTGARAELDAAVRERRAAGATVVFVDHDPRRLADEADAVYEVGAGRVREQTAAPGRETVAPGLEAAAPGYGTTAPADPDSPDPDPDPDRDPDRPGLDFDRDSLDPDPDPPAPASLVTIAVSGGRDPLPAWLPGDPVVVAPGPGGITTVLTVDAAHSDALLGALLAASWHVHHLTTEGVRV